MLECFDDEVADCALVVLGWEGAEAVAWELYHEEGDFVFPVCDYVTPPETVSVLSFCILLCLHIAALWPAMHDTEYRTRACVMAIALDSPTR